VGTWNRPDQVLQRDFWTYVDDAKQYYDTDSFGRDDLSLVAKLVGQARAFIFERLASGLKHEPNERV
jgi:hypothetical protein